MDLLLYLVKKEEVDIYEVNLTKIAREFIEYVDLMREFDIEIAGEFLVMASTLMYIKSKELLPVEQQVQADEEEEGEDPRWELIRKLVEYKKFKDAADKLETLEHTQENVYPRLPAKQEFEMPEDRGPGLKVSIFDLINAVNDVIKRVEARTPMCGISRMSTSRWRTRSTCSANASPPRRVLVLPNCLPTPPVATKWWPPSSPCWK